MLFDFRRNLGPMEAFLRTSVGVPRGVHMGVRGRLPATPPPGGYVLNLSLVSSLLSEWLALPTPAGRWDWLDMPKVSSRGPSQGPGSNTAWLIPVYISLLGLP